MTIPNVLRRRSTFGSFLLCRLLLLTVPLSGCGAPGGSYDGVSNGNREESGSIVSDTARGVEPATAEAENLPAESPAETSPETAQPEQRPAAAPEVTLKVVDWKGAEATIAAQKGKIVVMDLWATHCEPCVRELPHLVELQKKYPQDLVCITLSSDYIGLEPAPTDELQQEVLSVLKQKNAQLINLLSNVADEELYELLKLSSIPAVYVYGRDGALVKRFDNEQIKSAKDEFTYEKDIVPLVEELLKAAPQE